MKMAPTIKREQPDSPALRQLLDIMSAQRQNTLDSPQHAPPEITLSEAEFSPVAASIKPAPKDTQRWWRWHVLAELAMPVVVTAAVWLAIQQMVQNQNPAAGAGDPATITTLMAQLTRAVHQPYILAGVAFSILAIGCACILARQKIRLMNSHAVLLMALENLGQGVIMVDEQRRVPVINRRAIELLGLPDALMQEAPDFDDIRAWQESSEEFGTITNDLGQLIAIPPPNALSTATGTQERTRPDGTVLEIRTNPLRNGAMVRTYTDITTRRHAEARITRLAHHDALTGLANRTQFNTNLLQAIEAAKHGGRKFSVLCLDLDRFKIVNDQYGHAVGDRLLQQVAERLRSVVRENDPVARFGGDEFAILQVPAEQLASPSALATRLVTALSMPYEIDGNRAVIEVSIGIAVYPTNGDTSDELLTNADSAMYLAKNSGRNTFCFFEEEMSLLQQERRNLQLDLGNAIANNELEMHYQPVIDVESHEIVGFEALMRWTHPRRGLLSTADFLDVAEETGLIVPLGSWALATSCADAASWPSSVPVAVNLSASQLGDPELTSLIVRSLADSGLQPERLELEVAERVLVEGGGRLPTLMKAIKAHGVKVTLDDFGSGNAGMSHLCDLAFDKVKIDKALTQKACQNSGTGAVMSALITVGTKLGLDMVAEGVETEAQLAWLHAAGCKQAQGYLISQPVTSEKIPALLAGVRQHHRNA